ncbi:MAG: Holliday junction resolvase [Methanoregula sp.]
MSDFEREIVCCLNRFFKTHHIPGFACRLKPNKTMIQHVDVLVDSPDPAYNLSIEYKSIIDRKLYFTQHFRADRNNVHQVDAIADFLDQSGRIGYLALEFRQGPGKTSEAFLIPWETVVGHFRANKGITIEDARAGVALSRSKDGYVLENL